MVEPGVSVEPCFAEWSTEAGVTGELRIVEPGAAGEVRSIEAGVTGALRIVEAGVAQFWGIAVSSQSGKDLGEQLRRKMRTARVDTASRFKV